MKHHIFLLSAALSAALVSCASSKEVASDAYDTQEEQQVTQLTVSKAQKGAEGGDHYSQERLSGANRTLGQKMFNLNKYQKMDDFSLYVKPPIGGFAMRKATLIYREGTDIAGFECYYDSCAYAVQFAKAERKALVQAFEQYKKDFDEKKLDRKDGKSRQKYGSVAGYEDFGNISASMQYYCKPRVFFGYNFVKGNPYFCVYVKKAENLAVDQKREGGFKETIDQSYYFTKAQAAILTEFLAEDSIGSLQEETSIPETQLNSDSY